MRAAVTTGEAVVSFGTGPQIGESVAGDVVNTASRIQSVAPIGGVVVGDATQRATRSVVTYASIGDVELKGKAEPVAIWRADALLPSALDRDEDDPPRSSAGRASGSSFASCSSAPSGSAPRIS